MVRQEPKEADEGVIDEVRMDDVRILMIGDPGVGKTSLIYSLVNDEFDHNLPSRMADITIPAEVTTENVTIRIVDYSEQEQSLDDLEQAIQNSNVVCIIHVAGDLDGLDRVARHWIPIVRKCHTDRGTYKPIILVANKTDLVSEDGPLDKVSAIIQEFVDIEAFIEVSAMNQKNVVELFSTAQKAITYPLAPLFDPQLRVLTKRCRKALIEIFKLCDLDQDDMLNDHELNVFQENCFGTPLQKDALDDLKIIIKQSTIDGIVEDCLTLDGFLFLHALSIDKGRHDFTWQVLRTFNYDNQVNRTKNGTFVDDSFIDDTSQLESLSSNHDDSSSHTKSYTSPSDDNSEIANHEMMEFAWIGTHPKLIKAGLSLTIATLLSVLALKYLIRNGISRR